ncbi:proton-conducting transporter transmembrane domain-containing protein [Dendrosporobacter sp. 1207_IL3150]|uniref:proton-conducting transporter transmembrane domain-containing protein n=1 Tax=Dendrosporobacter sp. 1207_IL3150 TaxID=3084054 RepID=UPI002FDB8130
MAAVDLAVLLKTGLLCLIAGSIVPFLAAKSQKAANWAAHGCAFMGGLCGILAAAWVLLTAEVIELPLWEIVSGIEFRLKVDYLSAFFLLVISLITTAAAIYSIGYVSKYNSKKNIAYLGGLMNIFVLSMVAVVTVDSTFAFLIAWETMSLVSFLLVMFEHEKSQVRSAGYIYLVMTHIATAFILISFLLMFTYSNSFDFAVLKKQLPFLPEAIKSVLFLMCLIGFGAKAGIMPLHIWLPRAHPVAPSNISALMSAVMIKTAVYGLLRVTFDFLGGGPAWWGGILLALGLISAVWGILLAITENDIKRFLAFSSTENMGIILAGVGASIIFQANDQPLLAALSLTAALFHVLSHALFKGILFMGAGSVLFAAHTKDINELGGLIHRMPWTAGLFLVGGMSLAALPPFSGFVSEWSMLQSMLHLAFDLDNIWLKIAGVTAAALLALAGAFAAGGVVKHFGTAFLAMPRTKAAEEAIEVPITMRLGIGLLVIPTILFGLWPGVVLKLINNITNRYLSEEITGMMVLSIPFAGTSETLSMAVIFAAVAALLILVLIVMRLKFGKSNVVIDETWNCGTNLSSDMAYTGTSYSNPLVVIFNRLIRFDRQVEIQSKYDYYPKRISHRFTSSANIENVLYKPVIAMLVHLSQYIKNIQNGNLQNYLAYMVGALVLALICTR